MTKRQPNAWQRSAQWRAISRAAIENWNLQRAALPKCGAKRKRDGQPCQNLALSNGRCRYHGAATPRGDKWHVITYPNGKAPNAEKKLQNKLRQQELAAKRKKARLAAMTPAERERYDAWHRARRPGAAAERERRRREAKVAAEMRKALQEPNTRRTTPEMERLDRELQRLEAERAKMQGILGIGPFG